MNRLSVFARAAVAVLLGLIACLYTTAITYVRPEPTQIATAFSVGALAIWMLFLSFPMDEQ